MWADLGGGERKIKTLTRVGGLLNEERDRGGWIKMRKKEKKGWGRERKKGRNIEMGEGGANIDMGRGGGMCVCRF